MTTSKELLQSIFPARDSVHPRGGHDDIWQVRQVGYERGPGSPPARAIDPKSVYGQWSLADTRRSAGQRA